MVQDSNDKVDDVKVNMTHYKEMVDNLTEIIDEMERKKADENHFHELQKETFNFIKNNISAQLKVDLDEIKQRLDDHNKSFVLLEARVEPLAGLTVDLRQEISDTNKQLNQMKEDSADNTQRLRDSIQNLDNKTRTTISDLGSRTEVNNQTIMMQTEIENSLEARIENAEELINQLQNHSAENDRIAELEGHLPNLTRAVQSLQSASHDFKLVKFRSYENQAGLATLKYEFGKIQELDLGSRMSTAEGDLVNLRGETLRRITSTSDTLSSALENLRDGMNDLEVNVTEQIDAVSESTQRNKQKISSLKHTVEHHLQHKLQRNTENLQSLAQRINVTVSTLEEEITAIRAQISRISIEESNDGTGVLPSTAKKLEPNPANAS
ncbi:unnamed protein product [Clavelina lepadiformis]|uniref:Uncharacterized protein n=1 Tax=Clavelina lepadiformis TaxID=159417 RepID=A0ABP0GKT6_CLALP